MEVLRMWGGGDFSLVARTPRFNRISGAEQGISHPGQHHHLGFRDVAVSTRPGYRDLHEVERIMPGGWSGADVRRAGVGEPGR
ncbi:hypothetical protein ACGFH8_33195 [Micromonospora sp. NPDC049175]|uniref:hypothetical protein n=1 Tax=Micromonospora sp. NPDC049175 TaxID=3364266 RepID=UPI00371A53F6